MKYFVFLFLSQSSVLETNYQCLITIDIFGNAPADSYIGENGLVCRVIELIISNNNISTQSDI